MRQFFLTLTLLIASLQALAQVEDNAVWIDVRTPSEFEAGHVPGAAHLPFQSTWTRREMLPDSLDAPIVVYCEHGPRAA